MCSATYIHETDMPSGGSGYAYVIWDGTQQKSVISHSTIKGTIKEGGEVQAKWRGVMYAATIVKTGSQAHIMMLLSYCFRK